MLDIVRNIAKVDKEERFLAITSYLKEWGIPYKVSGFPKCRNIIVSFGSCGKRLVIGAHYDNVIGSTGANDNASSCAILLSLIKDLWGLGRRIDFVFFDLEEYGAVGSRTYIEEVGANNISAMVNLDVCGYGNILGIYEKGNTNNEAFINIMTEKNLLENKAHCYQHFGPGDDIIFEKNGIASISISVVDEGTDLWFKREAPFSNKCKLFNTMHHGFLDSINCVSEASMRLVYKFLYNGLFGKEVR